MGENMNLKYWVAVLASLVLLPQSLLAAEPFFDFQPPEGKADIPAAFQAWHSGFEKNKDYGESWFFLAKTDQGGVLFAMLSITNLGLRTFDTTCDIQFYPLKGDPLVYHKELKREDIKASTTQMDVKIGGARAWGGGMAYHFTLDEPEMKVSLDIDNVLPPYRFGDGSVKFYADKSAEWTLGLNVPKGRSKGQITAGGKTYDLAGYGYSDHGWTTVKLPSVIQKWYTLRIYDKKFGIVLHDLYLAKKFGSKQIRLGVFGVDNQIAGGMRDFQYTPTKWRKHKAGYQIPTAFDVSFKAGDYAVTGTVAEVKFLDAVEVLAQVTFPVRIVIQAFYSNPYMYRYLGRYDLDVTDKAGQKEHISGVGLVEANFF
ncbi:MAG: hypothetical protein C4523_16825 [Myxococcales bacterium]|nr:MAG: hypothetical protein C4523_16825 [Myxococcales bacterium]